MSDFVYVDNAATSWPKPEQVYSAVEWCLRSFAANPGRSSHHMSVKAMECVEACRLRVARLCNAPSPEHVIFTLNCTDSLNMAIKGLFPPGGRAIIGAYEHNSVTRPLGRLASSGATVSAARGTAGYVTDLDHFWEICRRGVDLAVVSHASNVTGAVQPVRQMARMVHEYGGMFVLDAAQTLGVTPIDMQQMGIDVLAAPGHKGLYGPMGTGVLVLGESARGMRPLREGGTGHRSEEEAHPSDLPWRLEAGTANLPGICGLLAGVEFVETVGIENVCAHESGLAAMLIDELSSIDGVDLQSARPRDSGTGVVSFRIAAVEPVLAGVLLDSVYSVGVRTGLHCAPAAHRELGTLPAGTIRASFGWFNTPSHVSLLADAVREIASGAYSI